MTKASDSGRSGKNHGEGEGSKSLSTLSSAEIDYAQIASQESFTVTIYDTLPAAVADGHGVGTTTTTT